MRSFVRKIPVGTPLIGEGELHVTAEVFLPKNLRNSAIALFCLPGGGINRGYFNLITANGDDRFSFAAQMTRRGFIVVTIDHLGIGASSRLIDMHSLTPDVIAATNAIAVDQITEQLRRGILCDELLPRSALHTIGVGHSMGGMLTAIQQAQYHQHSALVLLGFSTEGLVPALSAEEVGYANNPAKVREEIVNLARKRSSEPSAELPQEVRVSDIFAGAGSDDAAVLASKKCNDSLLITAGLFVMIPGSSATDCAQITVPVFLAVGDRDIVGSPHCIANAFTNAESTQLSVMPDTAHCHFLFPSTTQLFSDIASWVDTRPPKGLPSESIPRAST